jgi:hypothetical protein
MKRLSWCIIGIVFAVAVGALSVFATMKSVSFLAHPPSPSWLGIARHLVIVWFIYSSGSLIVLIALTRRARQILKDKKEKNVVVKPGVPLTATLGIVAASTLLLPAITGYGTVLFQWITLGSWALVAKATSGAFADHHSAPVWTLAFVLNVGAFLIPAASVFAVIGRRSPRIYAVTLIGWTLFYLASLFVLFPATDGP